MTCLRPRPWLWLVALFCLPLIPWGIFIYLAAQHPIKRLDVPPPAQQKAKS